MDSNKNPHNINGESHAGSASANSNSNNTSSYRPRTLRSHSEELGSGDGNRAGRRKSSTGGRSRKGVTFNSGKGHNYGATGVGILASPAVDPGSSNQCSTSGDLLDTASGGTDDDAFRPNSGSLNVDPSSGQCLMTPGGDSGDWQPAQSLLHTIDEGKRGAVTQEKRGSGEALAFNADHYNDFVNEMYTGSESERPLLPKTSRGGVGGIVSTAKPFPKSIVKSTSAANIQASRGESEAGGQKETTQRKPRLSLQSPTSGTDEGTQTQSRPHVQFKSDKIRTPTNLNGCQVEGKRDSFESFTGSVASSSSATGSSSSSSSSSSSEDNSSLDRFAEARPPDGGWGWVVVFAAFMVNLFSDGVTFSFGVIYVEFLKYFGEGKAKTAWIGSLFMAMPLLSGPIASFLTDRYGCRNVTVVGSIMASTGFILSAFTDSIEMLYFTFGILAGFGLSLCYVAAVVIVAYYFEKRRSFATGLSLCGSGIGTFIFAPFTQWLIGEYGWRGSVIIMAGIFLNMGVCGLLMRDLEWTTLRRKRINDQRKEEKARKKAAAEAKKDKCASRNTASDTLSISTNTAGGGSVWNPGAEDAGAGERRHSIGDDEEEGDQRLFSSLIVLPTFLKDGEKVPHEVLESLSTHRHILMMNNYATMPIPSFRDQASKQVADDMVTITTTTTGTNTAPMESSGGGGKKVKGMVATDNERTLMSIIERNQLRKAHKGHHKGHRIRSNSSAQTPAYLNDMRMHRHSLTYRGAMLNINRYRLRASSCPDIYRNSMTTIAKEKSQLSQGLEEFRNLVCNILDFSHFSDIRFVLFAVSNFLLYAWYDVPYVYIADYAISFGVTENMASMLISIVGIVNMFGEIILGWFGDMKINVTILYAFCMIFCGIIVFMVPSFVAFEAMGVLSGFFGFFIAANYSLTSIILVQLITIDRFTNAYGLLLLVQGVANLIGPPMAGYMRDVTGDYNLSFYAAGIFIVLSGILLMVLPGVDKYKKYKALSQRPNDSVTLENGDVVRAENGEKNKLGCV